MEEAARDFTKVQISDIRQKIDLVHGTLQNDP